MKKGMKKMFKHHEHENKCNCNTGCGSGIYFLGFLGAAIYYIQTATSFWLGVLGFLKAIVWPIFVVYDLLKFLA